MLTRLFQEPPFRLLGLSAVRAFVNSPFAQARWSAVPYTQYLVGLLEAAGVARDDGVPVFCAIEFGVATGRGLLALQRHARAVGDYTGVQIRVFGFDSGMGLPSLLPDHRDHPDYWRPGDFPMDEAALRRKLTMDSHLILGDVRETVPHFLGVGHPPVGFVSFDLDLYSGTCAALGVLRAGRMLRRTPLYFDDVTASVNHDWAGERLAITEFNERVDEVKIDRWHGVRADKVFPERRYWDGMYMAHDLRAISQYALDRETRHL